MSRDALRFSRYFSPYAFLFFCYLSYAGYDYLISPFHFLCYLSLAPYVFLSILLYVLTQVAPKEQAQDEYNWHNPNGTTAVYWHPL